MNSQSTKVERRYDLDWLRVLAILAVFVYHCGLIFGLDPFSIKNPTTYQFVDDWGDFVGSWGIPLIFLISGASVFYALGKAGPGRYLRGIVARLLVPLVVGIFTHIAFQVFLENVYKGTFSGSFFDFYPHYFDGLYAFGGNFAWMGLHLWYLEALFIFSLLCLPFFLYLKNSTGGRRALQALGDLLSKPGATYLFALPAMILVSLLDPETGWGTTALGGWSLFIYPCFFVSGFVIASSERLQASIQRWRWISVAAGILSWPAIDILWAALGDPTFGTWRFSLGCALFCLCAWSWLLTVLGFGMKHLRFNTRFLKYANEAVLPFYILHLTVVVSLAFSVVRWAIPDGLKFVFILTASFLGSMGVYEFLVRRVNLLRILFGMKRLSGAPVARTAEPRIPEATGTA